MKNIKRKACEFIADVKELTINNIVHYVKSKTHYSVFFVDENDILISQFNLQEQIKAEKGFLFTNKPYHYVFIQTHLSDSEKINVMLHELGHIFFDKEINPVYENETNATEFENSVLHCSKFDLFQYKLWNKRLAIISIVLAMILFLGLSSYLKSIFSKLTENTTKSSIPVVHSQSDVMVYVTPTGTKYHKLSCSYVNPETASELTIEKAQKSYAPCKVCKPNN